MKFDKEYLRPFLFGSNWEQMVAVKYFEQTELIPTFKRLIKDTPSVIMGDTRICQSNITDKILDYLDLLPFKGSPNFQKVEIRSDTYVVEDAYSPAYGMANEALREKVEGEIFTALLQLEFNLQKHLFGDDALQYRQDHSKAAAIAFFPNLHMRRVQSRIEYYLWMEAFCQWPKSLPEATATPV